MADQTSTPAERSVAQQSVTSDSWLWRLVALLVAGATLLLLGVFAGSEFAVAATLGALVGATELLSRYRDAPLRAVLSMPAVTYLAVNASASIAALALSNGFGWNFGLESGADDDAIEWTRVAVAGFGAAALFRSSLFVRRVGTDDVDVGPSSALKILLEVTDEAVDRGRGSAILSQAASIMRDVDVDQLGAIAAACLHAMQSMSPERGLELGALLERIDNEHAEDAPARRLAYGETLLKFFGEEVVRSAVKSVAELRVADAERAALLAAAAKEEEPDPTDDA